MSKTGQIPVETAVDFNAVHWPPHNRRRGAPGFYERHGYTRIGTYPDSRLHLDWHLYRKAISG